jgi:threonine synthase
LKDEEGFSFSTVLPEEFVGLEQKERRVTVVPRGAGWEGVRQIVEDEVEAELEGSR